jgi:hypothetical protein
MAAKDRVNRKQFFNEHCADCGVNTFEANEYYMVHNSVWGAAGMEMESGMLCIGCLEERLGRQLTSSDFIDAPINTERYRRSERLKNRLEMNSK